MIYFQDESSNIKEQLLKDFLPDDICPLGPQLVLETSGQIYQSEVVLSTSNIDSFSHLKLYLFPQLIVFFFSGREFNIFNKWWLSNGFICKSNRFLLPPDIGESQSTECRSIHGYGMFTHVFVYLGNIFMVDLSCIQSWHCFLDRSGHIYGSSSFCVL